MLAGGEGRGRTWWGSLGGLCVQVEVGYAGVGISCIDSHTWGQETHALWVRWKNVTLTFRGWS